MDSARTELKETTKVEDSNWKEKVLQFDRTLTKQIAEEIKTISESKETGFVEFFARSEVKQWVSALQKSTIKPNESMDILTKMFGKANQLSQGWTNSRGYLAVVTELTTKMSGYQTAIQNKWERLDHFFFVQEAAYQTELTLLRKQLDEFRQGKIVSATVEAPAKSLETKEPEFRMPLPRPGRSTSLPQPNQTAPSTPTGLPRRVSLAETSFLNTAPSTPTGGSVARKAGAPSDDRVKLKKRISPYRLQVVDEMVNYINSHDQKESAVKAAAFVYNMLLTKPASTEAFLSTFKSEVQEPALLQVIAKLEAISPKEDKAPSVSDTDYNTVCYQLYHASSRRYLTQNDAHAEAFLKLTGVQQPLPPPSPRQGASMQAQQ